jgi:hypothetical protein
VEEQDVEEVPQLPLVAPAEEMVPEEDLSPVEEEVEEEEDENLRGASFVQTPSGLYVPSRLASMAQSLRSISLSFDTECC